MKGLLACLLLILALVARSADDFCKTGNPEQVSPAITAGSVQGITAGKQQQSENAQVDAEKAKSAEEEKQAQTELQALQYRQNLWAMFSGSILVLLTLPLLIIGIVRHTAQPAASGSSRQSEWRWTWLIMVLHGIILAGAMAFFFLFASQFESFCNDAIGPGNLPDTTQMTLQLARFIRHDGCLLLPMLLVMDFGICWLMQSMGGRKSLIIWGITVLFAAITTLALMIASFLFPFYPAFDGMKG